MLLLLLLQAANPTVAPASTEPLFQVKPTIQMGGRVQTDFLIASGDSDLNSGAEIRRARLKAFGNIAAGLDYKMEYDFAGSFSGAKDVWLVLSDVAPGKVHVGHMDEPFGLGIATSTNHTTFLERSIVSESITPRRALGIQYSDHGDRWSFLGGWFMPTFVNARPDPLSPEDQAVTSRFVFRPWFEGKGARVFAVGAGVSYRMVDKRVLFAQRPGVHLARALVVASVPADGMISSTVDLAWQQNSVHAQAEYVHNAISDFAGADPTVSGWSADAGYFLSGGRRGYDTVKGGWSRVKPTSEGGDAWELAIGGGSIDLSEVGSGGLTTAVGGLNWYPNDHTRVMLNYIISDQDGLDDRLIALRVAIDF